MYAVTITEPGGPEVLRWEEVPDPEPGPGEVLIDIHATAVNRADILQRQGFYPPPPGRPPYPGLECSGRVAALGEGVAGWRVGDEVCALLSGGGYAEKVTIEATQLLPRPGTVSLTEAAGLPEAACTVWSNVFELAGLKAGQTLLVHGGGSGIGTFAIQLAKAWGAQVVTTARKAKHDALESLGADTTIDYAGEDFVEETKRVTGGRGADVILDIMGAAYLAQNVQALAPGGHLVVIGMQGGRKAELDLGALFMRRGSISATSLRARPPGEKTAIIRGVREHIWPLVANGAIRVVVDRVLPMNHAADAHRLVESSAHLGKVILCRPTDGQ